MSTTAEMQNIDVPYDSDAVIQYRQLSRGAVAAAMLAACSLLAIWFVALLLIPLVGLIVGLATWLSIRKYPDEYSGSRLALLSGLLCAGLLVGSIVGHTVAFAQEVPDGYELISFDQLRATGEADMVPESALALNGRKVYVRGYLHPSIASAGDVHQFVLVGDFETCCFGGQPKLTHMVEVTTPPHEPVHYSLRRRGFAGTLRVDTRLKSVEGLVGVFYQLQADVVH